MFVEYSWNIPMIYSRNIRKNFPMKLRGIFPEECSGNTEYTNIPWGMFQKYWMQEYSLNVPWISYECYMHFYRWIKKYNSRWGCSWYSLSVFEHLKLSWKSNKYVLIANNCLTTSFNNNCTILLSCDYVIIESIIMYTFL